VHLTIDLADDGCWIAETLELPGLMFYSQARHEAIGNVERLAIEVIAARVSHAELSSPALGATKKAPGAVKHPAPNLTA
jgi:hypothetical protein